MKKIVFIALAVLLLQGSQCGNEGTFPGNLGQVSDAAVVNCDAYPGEESKNHQCLVLASAFPEKGFLRVFDITDNQFILAPIAYFPLAVQVPLPFSLCIILIPFRLAANKKIDDQVFVLDALTKNVHVVPTKNNGSDSSFESDKANAGLVFFSKPDFITALKTDTQKLLIGVSSTGLSTSQVYDLGTKIINTLNWSSGLGESRVNDLVFDQTTVDQYERWNLYAATDKGISRLNFKNDKVTDWKTEDSIAKVVVGNATINLPGDGDDSVSRTVVMALSQTNKKALIYILKNSDGNLYNQNPFEVELVGIPLAGYVHAESDKCCGKDYTGSWSAVLTASGSLQYIKLQNLVNYYESKTKPGADTVELAQDFVSAPISVAEKAGVSADKTGGAVKMFGVEVKEINEVSGKLEHVNKIILVYSDLLASLKAGDSSKIKRIDAR
ncbi:MAG: hypothetical protein O2897_02740 [bacterium]|nr:hypothetical protein [bacterium]